MSTLYVTEQNAILRKTSDRLVIEKDRKVLAEIPCAKLETVLLFGNVQFTTQAAVEMLDHGIEMALFSLSGHLRGQLTPPKAKNIELRMAQYERSKDEAFCLSFARAVVRGKIGNALPVLRRFQANHPEVDLAAAASVLERGSDAAPSASSLDSLRGIEGTAAAAYFRALGRMLPPDLGFAGRNRRPPRDPVNALLSFGYVLVGSELQALLDGLGFDPYLGFYHQLDYGRPSLALDLLEELRPALVDRFTVSLLNLGSLGKDDFVGDADRGVSLTPEGLRRYFAAFEKELNAELSLGDDEGKASFRDLFRRQAHRLARAIREGEPYEPLRLPC